MLKGINIGLVILHLVLLGSPSTSLSKQFEPITADELTANPWSHDIDLVSYVREESPKTWIGEYRVKGSRHYNVDGTFTEFTSLAIKPRHYFAGNPVSAQVGCSGTWRIGADGLLHLENAKPYFISKSDNVTKDREASLLTTCVFDGRFEVKCFRDKPRYLYLFRDVDEDISFYSYRLFE